MESNFYFWANRSLWAKMKFLLYDFFHYFYQRHLQKPRNKFQWSPHTPWAIQIEVYFHFCPNCSRLAKNGVILIFRVLKKCAESAFFFHFSFFFQVLIFFRNPGIEFCEFPDCGDWSEWSSSRQHQKAWRRRSPGLLVLPAWEICQRPTPSTLFQEPSHLQLQFWLVCTYNCVLLVLLSRYSWTTRLCNIVIIQCIYLLNEWLWYRYRTDIVLYNTSATVQITMETVQDTCFNKIYIQCISI